MNKKTLRHITIFEGLMVCGEPVMYFKNIKANCIDLRLAFVISERLYISQELMDQLSRRYVDFIELYYSALGGLKAPLYCTYSG